MSRPSGVRVAERDGRARISVGGDLDLDTREAFLAAVERVAGSAAAVEIDLRGLDAIDSTGLTSLLVADRTLTERAGARPRFLIDDAGPVRRMLELTLLHLTLDVRIA